MTWFLLILGLLLLVMGLMAGQHRAGKTEKEKVSKNKHTTDEAWAIITEPVTPEEELIKIPDQRAWYRIGGGKFQQGLATGLGAGLLVAAVVSAAVPRPEAAPPRTAAQESPPDTQPAPEPVAPEEPKPEPPPLPANITFSVQPGELPPTIAERLKEQGLIEDEDAFLSRLEERRVDVLLKAGTFIIPTRATLDQVIDALTA